VRGIVVPGVDEGVHPRAERVIGSPGTVGRRAQARQAGCGEESREHQGGPVQGCGFHAILAWFVVDWFVVGWSVIDWSVIDLRRRKCPGNRSIFRRLRP